MALYNTIQHIKTMNCSPRTLVLLCLTQLTIVTSNQASLSCDRPLGLKSGFLPDANITASSAKTGPEFLPSKARLDGQSSWCSADSDKLSSWIQVTFGEKHRITAIKIQGNSAKFIWVKKFRVEYRLQGKNWAKFPKHITGNNIMNLKTGKKIKISRPIIANDIRIYPLQSDGFSVGAIKVFSPCLKLELYGCQELAGCGHPGASRDSTLVSIDQSHGGQARYKCNDGYNVVGSDTITCNNGRWSGQRPTCSAQCREPGTPQHGYRAISSFTSNSTATFTCKPGYDLIGSRVVYCINGTWSNDIPACKARCTHPGTSRETTLVSIDQSHGGQARYKCNDGYDVVGSDTITCNNGRWSVPRPMCIVSCPEPGTPQHGHRVISSSASNSTATFTCKRGYDLVGSWVAYCINGTWSNDIPVCKALCERPTPPNNGLVANVCIIHGGTVHYSCRPGFILQGFNHSECKDGQWTTPRPSCIINDDEDGFGNGNQAQCPEPGTPQHGYRAISSFTSNSTATFTCKPGYDLIGSRVVYCINETWSNDIPACKARCRRPIAPSNGLLVNVSIIHGGNVHYSCRPGFILQGSNHSECKDGQWTRPRPSCIINDDEDGSGSGNQVTCIDPGYPINGGRQGTGIKEGDIISFFCIRGYALFGQNNVTCMASGQWSGYLPQCKKTCNDPGVPNNGGRHGNGFLEGQSVLFFCHKQYELVGHDNPMCINGQWTNKIPTCKLRANMCSAPNVLSNMVVVKQNKHFYNDGDRVIYVCKKGYFSYGTRTRKCRNGRWSTLRLKCIPRSCGDPGTPKHGSKSGLVYNVHNRVSYRCFTGYVLHGSQILQCMVNARWNDTTPTCKKVDCGRLPSPTYGTTKILSTSYGSKAEFECFRRGYKIAGPSTRRCQANGQWSGTQPYCKVISCSRVSPPSHGTVAVSAKAYSYKAAVIYKCNAGYVMDGKARSVCLDNGIWSSPTPTCKRRTVRCSRNWIPYNNHCYIFKHKLRRPLPWQRMQARCRRAKADLLNLHDNSEWNFVKSHLKRSVRFYAIGLRKKRGAWRWSKGSPIAINAGSSVALRFIKTITTNSDCGVMKGRSGEIDAVPCRSRRLLKAYICKK